MIKDNFNKMKSLLLPSIYLALVVMLKYNPLENIKLNKFNRIMGHAVSMGVDVSKRNNRFFLSLFIISPIIILGIWCLSYILCKNKKESFSDKDKIVINFLNYISAIAFIPLIFTYINRLSLDYIFKFEVIIPTILIIILILYIYFRKKFNLIDFKEVKWCIISSIPILILITILSYKINLKLNTFNISLLYGAIIIIMISILSLTQKNINFINLKRAYLFIMFAPILVSLFLELTNILNQYNIFIESKVRYSLFIYIICIISSIVAYVLFKKIYNKDFNFERVYYPILVCMLALISCQMPLQIVVNTDYFESANHGVAISEFFNCGKLPIIETFDAHMLSQQLGGYIYGILNKDHLGAIFSPYNCYIVVLYYLLFYFLIKKFFNNDIALLITLIFPLNIDFHSNVYFIGFMIILSVIKIYKENSITSYVVYWFSVAISCFYLLDLAFSFIASSIITLIFLYIVIKKRIRVKEFLLTGLSIALLFIFVFCILCFSKGINPMVRALEFLNISLSNSNWGLAILGNTEWLAFSLSYFIMPIVAIIVFGNLVFLIIRKKDIKEEQIIICSILFFAYVFNFSRGIVRHSLVEFNFRMIVFTIQLFFAMAAYIISNKNKLFNFCITYFVIFIFISSLVNSENKYVSSLLESSLNKQIQFEQYETKVNAKVERVVISDEMKEFYIPIKDVFNNIMKDDETYIDFTNQTLLYALTNKEKPVYVNQSPGLLSGEYTQERFIEEIKEKGEKVAFVLMPYDDLLLSKDLDGINNAYRYYLLSEYISLNYKPIAKINGVVLWCKNSIWLEKYALIESLSDNNDKLEIIDINYGDGIGVHDYLLKEIPYLWGNYDEIKVADKEKQIQVCEDICLNEGEFKDFEINISNLNKDLGNYINLNATSNSDGQVNIELGSKKDGEFKSLAYFNFYIHKGVNLDYLLRVSSDFLWYLGNIDTIRISSDVMLEEIDISILKGDTLK